MVANLSQQQSEASSNETLLTVLGTPVRCIDLKTECGPRQAMVNISPSRTTRLGGLQKQTFSRTFPVSLLAVPEERSVRPGLRVSRHSCFRPLGRRPGHFLSSFPACVARARLTAGVRGRSSLACPSPRGEAWRFPLYKHRARFEGTTGSQVGHSKSKVVLHPKP